MSASGSNWADRLATAAVLAGLTLAVPAAAQEAPGPLDTPKLDEAAGMGWFQSTIVSGRVVVTARRLGSVILKSAGGAQRENLTIRIAGGAPVLNYQLSTSSEELSIEVTGGDQLQILLTAKGDSKLVPLRFDQPAEGPLSLAVGSEGQEQVYRAASLWHLFIAEPEVCGRHLAPLLQLLDRHRDPAEMATEVESALVQVARASGQPDRRRWAGLVEQLGDHRFARREAADRQLRREGRPVISYLQRLDSRQLDAEQHYRIRRIIQALSDRSTPDTPGQVAAWLAGDPAIWLALLSRDEVSTRRFAAEQLEGLLGRPIDFDPAADAATRRRQLDQLHTLVPEK